MKGLFNSEVRGGALPASRVQEVSKSSCLQ